MKTNPYRSFENPTSNTCQFLAIPARGENGPQLSMRRPGKLGVAQAKTSRPLDSQGLKAVLLAGAVVCFTPWLVQASPPAAIPPRTVIAKAIGTPTWKPTDFQLFTAPIGTASDGYAEFGTTLASILPPPKHVVCPTFGPPCISLGGPGPGIPHSGFTTEMSAGVAALGFAPGPTFRVTDFSNGNGIYCTWMIVPAPGGTGASPDFNSGPIIPNALCPIHVAGATYRNQQLADPFLGTFDVPALTPELCCPFINLDGHSHIPIFFAENLDFVAPGTGPVASWEFRVTMTDNTGNGWEVSARFVVTP